MQTVLFTSHILLCFGLFFACFCKFAKTDESTSIYLRISVFLEGVASLSLFFAVISWGFEPNIWTNILMSSTLFYLFITRKVWEFGVPLWGRNPNSQLTLF